MFFNQRVQELEEQIKQLECEKSVIESDNKQLTRRLEVRETNNNILRAKVVHRDEVINELRESVNNEKEANKVLCEASTSIVRKLNKEEQDNKVLQSINLELQKVNDDLITRLRDVTAYKSQVETLKGEVDKKDRFAQELKKYAENLIERLERNQNVINMKNETIEHLQTRLNRKADNALLQEAQSRKVAEQEERIKELETKLYLSERRERWANNDIEKWKNKFEEKRTEAFNSYQDNKKLQAKIERQDTIINVLAK